MKLKLLSASLIFASVSAFAADPYGTSSSYSDTGSTTGSNGMPRLNVQGGISTAKIDTDNTAEAPNKNWKSEGAASLTGDFGMANSPLVLELGAAYRNLGVSTENNFANYNIHYLGVPVLAKLYIGDPMTTAFFVRAGVRPSWAVSKDGNVGGLRATDNSNAIKDFDLPGVAGIGVKIGVAKTVGIILSGDYERSILNINNTGIGKDLRNEDMVFQGGLSFNL